jgi:hypothetical protein
MMGRNFAERISDVWMLSFMSTLKRRTAELMVRCSGIGIDAAASMSTTGASSGSLPSSARERMCVYAFSSSFRNSSASNFADTEGAAATAATGTAAGGGVELAQATV